MKRVHIPRWFKIDSIVLAILLVAILAGLIALVGIGRGQVDMGAARH